MSGTLIGAAFDAGESVVERVRSKQGSQIEGAARLVADAFLGTGTSS